LPKSLLTWANEFSLGTMLCGMGMRGNRFVTKFVLGRLLARPVKRTSAALCRDSEREAALAGALRGGNQGARRAKVAIRPARESLRLD